MDHHLVGLSDGGPHDQDSMTPFADQMMPNPHESGSAMFDKVPAEGKRVLKTSKLCRAVTGTLYREQL